jgi:hypothetical protein
MVMIPGIDLSLENLVFDPTYYALTALVLVLSSSSFFIALRNRGKFVDSRKEGAALGIGLIALGFSVIFLIAFILLALFRIGSLGGFLYLQMEFILVYAGCTLVIFGVSKGMFSHRELDTPTHRRSFDIETMVRSAPWLAFVFSVGIALIYLFNPQTYTVTVVGGIRHVAQETIFWLPPFVTILVGALSALILTIKETERTIRVAMTWLELFFVSEIVGLLKESNLIRSFGDPYVDLLAAYVPFTLGSIFLLMSARKIRYVGLNPLEGSKVFPNFES